MGVLEQSIIAFITQVAFLWARTYNIHATAKLEVINVIKSGMVIHLLWLVGISIGANGVYQVLVEYKWNYLPVPICSLIGSVLGSYIGLIKRIKKYKK